MKFLFTAWTTFLAALTVFGQDASLDLTFVPGTNQSLKAIDIQVDGQIVAIGNITASDGVTHSAFARINPNGSVDGTLNSSGTPFATIRTVLVQPDGKILIGGAFDTINGVQRNHIARLLSDGTLDTGFSVNLGQNLHTGVVGMTLQPDGKIIMVGDFITGDLTTAFNVARLNADGSFDGSFNRRSVFGGYYHNAFSVALQSDGKILVGGSFTTINGSSRRNLARLQSNGLVDTFNPAPTVGGTPQGGGATFDYINSVLVQNDGQILIGGVFNTVGGINQPHLARLTSTGVRDASYYPWQIALGTDDTINAMALQADGKLVVGGFFYLSNTNTGIVRTNLARLNTDGTIDTGFDAGNATDSAINAVALQADGKILIGGGFHNYKGTARAGIARLNNTVNNTAPVITSQPANQTVYAGETVSFSVQATGFPAPVFQWFKDNVILPNQTNRSLTLFSIHVTDGGNYSVVASNSLNFAVSSNAVLTVNPSSLPFFTQDPASQTVVAGTNVVLSGMANGVPAPTFQWQWKGTNISGATNTSLTLSNVTESSSGDYTLVASSVVGSATSHVATVTVLRPPPGSLDSTVMSDGANGTVFSVLFQPDEKIVLGGAFTTINGTNRSHIARLNSDGSLDIPTGSFNGDVYSLARRTNGMIIVGGNFTSPQQYLSSVLNMGNNPLVAPNSLVLSVAIERAQTILFAGAFTTVNGVMRPKIARVRASDGNVDLFNQAAFDNSSTVYSVVVQPDDNVLIAGQFSTIGGVSRSRIARFLTNGVLDTTFDPNSTPTDNQIRCMALQADGKIIIGGLFAKVGGVTHPGIARLSTNGTCDTNFTASAEQVFALTVQPDGKILLGGGFTNVNGVARNRIARLNPDGSLDVQFDPGTGANDTVQTIAVSDSGKIAIGGSFTNFNGQSRKYFAVLTGGEPTPGLPFITAQPVSRTITEGTNVSFTAVFLSNPYPTFQWLLNGQTLSNATNATLNMTNVLESQAGGYSVILSNSFGSVTSAVATLTVNLPGPGGLDAGFTTGVGVNKDIKGIGLQSSGRLIVGGQFTNYQGTAANRLMRLLSNGTFDPTFTIGTGPNSDVTGLVVQPDDKIVMIGGFGTYNGVADSLVARLNADGTRDTNFNPNLYNFGANTVSVQSDGQVLLGGLVFYRSDFAVSRSGIVRLNTNGVLDAAYNTNEFNGQVFAIAVQPDGNAVVGGTFQFAGRTNIVRLDLNGVVDATFNPGFGVQTPFGPKVSSIALQPDGKMIIGGTFLTVDTTAATNLARLNANGSVDTTFTNVNWAGVVNDVRLQPNGKIVVGGTFTAANGQSYNRIARFNTNGVLDTEFVIGTGANSEVTQLLLQPDGKIWLAGLFTTFDGKPRNRLARIYGDTPAPSAPLIATPILSGTSFSCTVSTVVGLTYTLEFKDSLSDLMWSSESSITGDGSVKTLIDATSAGSTRFYRVRVQ